MIPKVIHLCWLSGDPMPKDIKRCLKSWKKILPDYRIKLWDAKSIDLSQMPQYVKEAIKKRKWAFAADYIRMHALYTEGGIYMDSDVLVKKSFDEFLNHKFFSSLEYHPTVVEKNSDLSMLDAEGRRIKDGYLSAVGIQAAVMGAEKGSQFVKDVIDWYADKTFIDENGDVKMDVVSPQIYAHVAEKYGFRYLDKDQQLDDGIFIYRSEIFAGNKHEETPASYAIHYCAHSWHPGPIEKLQRWLKKTFRK